MTFTHDETESHDVPRYLAPLAEVRGYWEALREGNAIPMRSQVNPRGLENALSSTFLIERIAPGLARFRIAGMDFADLMGMEVRGMPISALIAPEARTEFAARLEPVFQSPAIVTLDLTAATGLGRPGLIARMLLLPLRDAAGRSSLALGCIAINGSIGRSPRRFDISRAQVTKLDPIAPPVAAENRFDPKLVTNTQAFAFAEAAAAYNAAPSGKGKPYLRVVK
jgi:hypothetical protein